MEGKDNCICMKKNTVVPGYIFPSDEFIFVCRSCGRWYDLEYDEVINYITEAEENDGE